MKKQQFQFLSPTWQERSATTRNTGKKAMRKRHFKILWSNCKKFWENIAGDSDGMVISEQL